MPKSKIIITLSAAITFFLILLGFSLALNEMNASKKAHDESEQMSFVDSNKFTYKIGEKINLDSEEDEKGEPYDWTASFPWVGTIELTVSNPRIHTSLDDSSLKETSIIKSDLSRQKKRLANAEEPVLVTYEVHLKNIDAEPKSDLGFSIDSFELASDSFASSEPIYLDGTYFGTSKYTGDNGYSFDFDENGEANLTIGFLASSEVKNDIPEMRIGTTGIDKYVLRINPTDLKEV